MLKCLLIVVFSSFSNGQRFSGVYIAVDIGIQSYEENTTSVVDVYALAQKMSEDRNGIISTTEYYNYIYKVRVDCGCDRSKTTTTTTTATCLRRDSTCSWRSTNTTPLRSIFGLKFRLQLVTLRQQVSFTIMRSSHWTIKLGIQTAGRKESFHSLVFVLTRLHFGQWNSLPFSLHFDCPVVCQNVSLLATRMIIELPYGNNVSRFTPLLSVSLVMTS